MKRKGIAVIVATIIIVFTAIALLVPVLKDHAHLGLDLQGGVLVRLEAPEGTSADDMSVAMGIISNRVNSLGVAEPEIRLEGQNRISVELPGVKNAEEAVDLIGTTAKLEFVRSDNNQVVLTGADLKDAHAYADDKSLDMNNKFAVSIKFKQKGAEAFSDATKDLVSKYSIGDNNRRINILLDGQSVSNPTVNVAITNGEAQISGGFQTLADAQNLAVLLNSGSLPVKMEIVERNTVGAQLGPDAIHKSLVATVIGCLLLVLFILVIYKLPGAIAVFSLVLYSLLLACVLILIKSTITLQVIAAFLLSIGMAVDANVLIYERIKDELRAGKTPRVATESGFKKAFSTVIDANVTTLIAGIVLIIMGTGEVRGFAVTLCIGIGLSLFTAITFTRFILRNLVNAGLINSSKFYGVKRIAKEVK